MEGLISGTKANKQNERKRQLLQYGALLMLHPAIQRVQGGAGWFHILIRWQLQCLFAALPGRVSINGWSIIEEQLPV